MAVGTYQGVAGLAPRLFTLEEETGSHHGHGHVHRTRMLICMHNCGSSLHLPPHRRSSIIIISRDAIGSVRPLVHFGAVVADAPSPLSTPRSATGQAPLRLGKPVRMKCRASPVLLFMRTGRVVSGTVGIVRATVPFHGEHDAPEPTKEGLRCCGCH